MALSTGTGGIIGQASNVITKLQKVVNPPPIQLRPDGTPVDPNEAIRDELILCHSTNCGNFVSFQNMSNFHRSDHQRRLQSSLNENC